MPRPLLGWVLIGAGAVEVGTAVFLLAPRLPEARRGVVVAAVASGGALMALLGAAFLAGVL